MDVGGVAVGGEGEDGAGGVGVFGGWVRVGDGCGGRVWRWGWGVVGSVVVFGVSLAIPFVDFVVAVGGGVAVGFIDGHHRLSWLLRSLPRLPLQIPHIIQRHRRSRSSRQHAVLPNRPHMRHAANMLEHRARVHIFPLPRQPLQRRYTHVQQTNMPRPRARQHDLGWVLVQEVDREHVALPRGCARVGHALALELADALFRWEWRGEPGELVVFEL